MKLQPSGPTLASAIALVGIFFAASVQAYSEFIGYGYSSCLTCHVNGSGSGPLNDYGRALWSAEIASRSLFPRRMTDEILAKQSGFLGAVPLPYWFRPHLKFRDLSLKQNFKGPNEVSKYYRMQQDVGATFSDPVGKFVAVITFGNMQYSGQGDQGRFLAREYYLRAEVVKTWWLYIGLLEKVFGIRNINHNSFQRFPQGFNPTLNNPLGAANSQGVVLQKVEDTWDAAFNVFTGNPYDEPEYRHKGFSTTSEFEVGDKKRLGVSLQSAASEKDKKTISAIHYRQGLSKGSAVLFEYGFLQDNLEGMSNSGSYNLLQTSMLLTRGYSLRTEIERYNQDFKAASPDQWRFSVGILAFPMPRLELRGDIVNGRAFSTVGAVDEDQWFFQGMVHVSL
jgi:hypothetical protein